MPENDNAVKPEPFFHGAHYNQWGDSDLICEIQKHGGLAECVQAILEEVLAGPGYVLDYAETFTYCREWLQRINSDMAKLLPPEPEEPQTFKEFAERHKITVEKVYLGVNYTREGSEWSKNAFHYQVTLLKDGKVVLSGVDYSVGSGCLAFQFRDKNYLEGKSYNTCSFRSAMRKLRPLSNDRHAQQMDAREREASARDYAIEPADILQSLSSDSSNLDQTFEDWAADYGYGEDSRKAFSIFEACHAIKGRLIRALGYPLFNELQGCEEE